MSNEVKTKRKYDERQMYEQGRGYFFGFWALIIYLAFIVLFEMGFEKELLSSASKCYLGIILGITVYVSYCIFKDAYFPLGGSAPTILVTNFTAFALLVVGIIGFDEASFDEASFDERFVLVACLAMMAIIDISIFTHHRIEKKRTKNKK